MPLDQICIHTQIAIDSLLDIIWPLLPAEMLDALAYV